MDALRRMAGVVQVGLLALLLSVGVLLGSAPVARADDNSNTKDDSITQMNVTATPHKDGGNVDITLDLTVDFGNTSGHGPFVSLPERWGTSDPDAWRVISMSNLQATSPDADATMSTEHKDGVLVIRLGSKYRTFVGQKHYQLTYTAHGLLLSDTGSKDQEFNWAPVGPGWQVPINNVKATVKAPAASLKTACFTGRDAKTPCQAPATGTEMTWTASNLRPGQQLQAVASFPEGTFTNAGYQTERRVRLGNMFEVNAASLSGAAIAALLAGGGATLLIRRNRGERFAGVAPGTSGGQRVNTKFDGEIPVAFSPPRGASAAEVGVLIDGSADMEDVSAMVVDLAVRGHLVIHPEGDKKFTLTQTPRNDGSDPLRPLEQRFLRSIFSGGQTVSSKQLGNKRFADAFTTTKSGLDDVVTRKPLQWYKGSPAMFRGAWMVGAVVLTALGVGMAWLFGQQGWGLIGIPVAIAGLVLLFSASKVNNRTAEGSAAYAQALGFRKYLTTAEADQIKFEEGVDVFSRYLPYAMVFGVADRWAKVFEDLAARGQYEPDLTWYGGSSYGFMHGYALGSLGHSLTNSFGAMTQSMNSAVAASAAASAGSGGGSGFGGGGGIGGGGGGTW